MNNWEYFHNRKLSIEKGAFYKMRLAFDRSLEYLRMTT